MKSRLGIFLLTLLCLPTAASAAIVNINYTAHIYATTGDGLGYQNGDVISGSYRIDTSKAEGKNVDTSIEVWYYGSVESGMLQSNFASTIPYGYVDYVRVYDGIASGNDLIILDKVLSASNAGNSILETLGISFEFNGLNWISDISLNNINFLSNEGGWSNGAFARWDLTSWTITDSANFWLDSVEITSIPASVPEPTPLVLLSIAVVGLVFRRRLN